MGVQETSIFEKFKDVFKNKKLPVKGDEGVLQDVITFLSSNENGSTGLELSKCLINFRASLGNSYLFHLPSGQ